MPRRPARAWGSVERRKHRRAIELRNHQIPEAELVDWREGNRGRIVMQEVSPSGGVKEPGMCGHSPRENRETSGRILAEGRTPSEALGKDNIHNPAAHSPEESDAVVVPEKSANKGAAAPAESMEERTAAKRNSKQKAAYRMQGRKDASNGLDRVRQRAEADKTFRFENLFHFLKVDLLRESFYKLKRQAAAGLDGVNWYGYEQTLEERLPELQDELHKGSYRATPAKRTYLTKPDGRQRPLGIQAIEDKVVQQACVTILTEVFEPNFSGFSYGSRPGRAPHDALDALSVGIERHKINWILDVDIEGFFDKLPHEHLMNLIGERVADKRMLRLIRKWLKVGWIENAERHPGTIGTPQGSVISPLLANIFLNAVMDKWGSKWRKNEARGEVIIVRYVDDVVYGFQHESDAKAFHKALEMRLEVHGLKLHPKKTRIIEFGRFAASNRRERKQGKPETFDFLGFTHICGKTRNGKYSIKRKTIKKRLRQKLEEIKRELIRRMHHPLKDVGKWLSTVMRGLTNYYAIPGNMNALRAMYTELGRVWIWTIRRRSHKARQRWTWERFYRLQQQWIPRPRVIHPYPNIRFDAKHSR